MQLGPWTGLGRGGAPAASGRAVATRKGVGHGRYAGSVKLGSLGSLTS